MTRPKLSPSQTDLLDRVEEAVRAIAHPLACAGCFNHQLALSLEATGLYSTLEVVLPPGNRRCDVVVVSAAGTCAVEVDGRNVRPGTVEKFRDMEPAVLRMLVLRHRRQRPVVPFCDRVVCLSASLRPLSWLTSGVTLTDEPRRGPRSVGVPSSLLGRRRAG